MDVLVLHHVLEMADDPGRPQVVARLPAPTLVHVKRGGKAALDLWNVGIALAMNAGSRRSLAADTLSRDR